MSWGLGTEISTEKLPKKVGVALLSGGLERSAESRHGAITSTKIGEDDKVRVSVRSATTRGGKNQYENQDNDYNVYGKNDE